MCYSRRYILCLKYVKHVTNERIEKREREILDRDKERLRVRMM